MMIRSETIFGSEVRATDGDVGKVKDLFFDDLNWGVRYLVVEAGGWLTGRHVLLSPTVVGQCDWTNMRVDVRLTRQQVKDSPPVDTDLPLSRQKQIDLARHYGWADQWPGAFEEAASTQGDPHLRSAKEVDGYYLEAADGRIGHVAGFVVDDAAGPGAWAIRYLVIDTPNWLPGKQVQLSPAWAESIRWEDRTVHVPLTREKIRNAPEHDPSSPVNRSEEEVLYDYYGLPKYWHKSTI
jgi:hypothetical protein